MRKCHEQHGHNSASLSETEIPREAARLIRELDLSPHPEGGWYRQVHRSAGSMKPDALPAAYGGERPYITSIYFLITAAGFSAFHRLRSDELWYFHEGNPLDIEVITPQGRHETRRLGRASEGLRPQAVVEAGLWFASRVARGGSWSLVGCAVAPGFDFEDFELADRRELTKSLPEHRRIIRELTR